MPLDPEELVRVAVEAGNAIMEVYESSEEIQVKSKDDHSPLTQADLAAHETIIAGLMGLDPGTPIVSEEGREGNPNDSDLAWLVDPLDGTKEFIKRNGMLFRVRVSVSLMNRGCALSRRKSDSSSRPFAHRFST